MLTLTEKIITCSIIIVGIIPMIVFDLWHLIYLTKLEKQIKENNSTKQMIKVENESWEKLELDEPNNSIECVEAIIDDAMCHGFEFKVDNGNIYFREVE